MLICMRSQTVERIILRQGRDKPEAEDVQGGVRSAMQMIMVPGSGLGEVAKIRRLAMDVMKLLALPILALVTNFFLETIGFGVESVLTTLNLSLGVVLLVLSLPTPIVRVVKEVKRVRRLRWLTNDVEPRLSLGELRKLKMCQGSGRSALKARHWKDGRCQHCFASPDLVDKRIEDHLIPQAYIGVMPVECDPRLIAIWNR